ncbi:MAG: 4Fe-4S binding protein [Anaerolineae bacterium]
MYPTAYRRLPPHWARRLVTALVGVVLLYAPFAYLSRAVLRLGGQEKLADAHSLCLRMPIQWLAQPWMYATIFSNPAYPFSVAFLPLTALVLGPVFCGWVCPAGHMTEFVSRIVPPRFQLDLSGKVNPVPVRYGFTLGMMGVALVGGNACCSFCNFTHAQNIISAISGDTLGISYLASFSIVSFVIWFVLMGLFTRGGRGWCNLLCPAGALMGLAHKAGIKLGISRHMAIDEQACTECG